MTNKRFKRMLLACGTVLLAASASMTPVAVDAAWDNSWCEGTLAWVGSIDDSSAYGMRVGWASVSGRCASANSAVTANNGQSICNANDVQCSATRALVLAAFLSGKKIRCEVETNYWQMRNCKIL